MGYGLRDRPYREDLLPLIGYLQINHIYGHGNPGKPCNGHTPEDKDDFPLECHWAGDDCELVNEYNRIYDEINDSKSKYLEGIYSGPKWVNISKQLFEEYNAYIRYWNDPDDFSSDYHKKKMQNNIYKLKLDIGWAGAHFDD